MATGAANTGESGSPPPFSPAPTSRPRRTAPLSTSAVRGLIATADSDGYIGTHDVAHRRDGWDIWGRKYVLLGLIAAFDLTGDRHYLDAARRHADTLLAEVGPGKANIAELGYAAWKGLPPSSVLEPIVLPLPPHGRRPLSRISPNISSPTGRFPTASRPAVCI